MHIPQQLTKRYIVLQVQDVSERLDLSRMVIKHQEQPRKGQVQKQKEAFLE